jgi:crotonobetainyl-CoA:carnitine CoA-transferase CaiB-like acyl-CoA transferase
VLDLKSADGRADFDYLVGTADAVVNNLRGDQPGKLGLDYATLSPLKQSLVCLHISAYGRDNDRASRPGYDFLMQAEAGLMSLTGDPDGSPARFGPSIIDYMTGVVAMTGLLSGIIQARQTGVGCDVDTSLFEVALHQLGYAGLWYLNDQEVTTRLARSAHFSASPAQTLRAKDGWIFIMCLTEKFWQLLTTLIDREDLAARPDFVSSSQRFKHREQLTEELDAVFITKTMAEWVDLLGHHLPVGPVNDIAAALDSPFVKSIDMISHVPHPARPDFRQMANPLRINGQRLPQKSCSALGADNEALLPHRSR